MLPPTRKRHRPPKRTSDRPAVARPPLHGRRLLTCGGSRHQIRVTEKRARLDAPVLCGSPFLLEFAAAREGAAGHSHVDIAQILVADDLGPAVQDCEQYAARVFEPALVHVENRQVVVSLERVWKLAHELVEDADRLVPLSLLHPQDSVQNPSAKVAGLLLEKRIERQAGFAVTLLERERECAVEGCLGERSSG